MKPGTALFGVTASALLLGVAGALYLIAENSDGHSYRKSIVLVRQIHLLSSDWSIETARVRSDPLADFDSLAAFVPRMTVLTESLADTARRISGLPDRLAGDIHSFLSIVDAKVERIERFKTGYAVTRNSKRYLPLAAEHVREQALAAAEVPLATDIMVLTDDMSAYLRAPGDATRDRLGATLETLRGASVAYPPVLANALVNYIAHAQVLLDKHQPTEQLFEEATSNELSDLVKRLDADLAFALAGEEVRATWYERGILAALAALVLLWIVLGVRRKPREVPVAAPIPGLARAPQVPETKPAPVEVPAPAGPVPAPEVPASELPAGEDAEVPVPAAVAADAPASPVPWPEAVPAPSVVSPVPLAGVPAAASAPSPAVRAGAVGESDRQSLARYEFLAGCVADAVARAAAQIGGDADRLHRACERARDPGGDRRGGPDLDESVAAVAREASALADLASRLGAFSRRTDAASDYETVDVGACLDEVIEASGATAHAAVAKNFGGVPELFASKTEIRLLLAQLIDNAVRAVDGLPDRAGLIRLDAARRNGEVLVTVIDNGVGIAPEHLPKVFEPFHSSRDAAMGIGLALASHLVKKYKGTITVNSLPGHGSVVRVSLPVGIPAP